MALPFSGKVIAVSGAASGIALATSKILFERGASLSLADLRKEQLDAAVETISGGSCTAASRIITTALDVRDSDSIDAWISKTMEKFGRLDGAANVAGVIGPSLGVHGIADLSNKEWELVLGTNLSGIFYALRAQLRVMQGPGSIVNMASTAGLEGYALNAPYCASKHGVIGITRAAAKEVGKIGIRINAVAPGLINTPMVAAARSTAMDMEKAVTAMTALGRIGQSEEVGKLISFLLSDDALYISGAVYGIDGGQVC